MLPLTPPHPFPTPRRARSADRRIPLPVAWAAASVFAAASPAHALKLELEPEPRTPAATDVNPVFLSAQRVQSVLDRASTASGEVELRQAGLVLTADSLEFIHATQVATARGQILLLQDGNRFSGTEAQVDLAQRTGHVLDPRYHFGRIGAGGQAQRLDFVGSQRLSALQANYTSCPVDGPPGSDEPAWVLSTQRLDLDFEHNEGRAEGAVLRFLGVPILAAPVLSFPATDARKTGWLPPTIYPFDSRSGAEVEVPWYWNIAPNHDLTLTPGMYTRRGASLKTELRYLMPSDEGRLQTHLLPGDNAAGLTRYSLFAEHEGQGQGGLRYGVSIQEASDDAYWKDFSRVLPSLTPRLLSQELRGARQWSLGDNGRIEAYGRVQGWRVLQDAQAIAPPYQRMPQLGVRAAAQAPAGLHWALEGELNRFVLRDQITGSDTRSGGHRAHVLGALTRPLDVDWGWLTPRLSFNAAAYDTDAPMADGRRRASRVIPTVSLDAGLRFERDATLLGREVRQTLEPRLHYANTPWRAQESLPNFDSAVYDFNELSIYGDNAFSGVDFATDTHQVTLGASSRWLDPRQGAELMRLGLAQRFLLRDQRITPDRLSPTGLAPETGTPASRFSDVLLYGSGSLLPHWRLDGTIQYNPDLSRTVRSILSARWQPERFHTISATYRYARSLSEQMELGWQWPIYRRQVETGSGGSSCGGTLYGVGRLNYSMKDSRITDAIAGIEYDAGCWIGRVVAERVSTGSTEATTRLMVQLELVGLSRLGANPLKVLKDNIPGYQLLREDPALFPTSYEP